MPHPRRNRHRWRWEWLWILPVRSTSATVRSMPTLWERRARRKLMKADKAFTTAICAILVGATSSLRVLGQIAPVPRSPLTDSSGDSQPLSAAAVCPSQDASGDDAGFGRPCGGARWTASADFIILDRIGTVPYALVSTSAIRRPSVPSVPTPKYSTPRTFTRVFQAARD